MSSTQRRLVPVNRGPPPEMEGKPVRLIRRDLRASLIEGAAFGGMVGIGETYLPWRCVWGLRRRRNCAAVCRQRRATFAGVRAVIRHGRMFSIAVCVDDRPAE